MDVKGGVVLTLDGGAKLTPEGLKFDGVNALGTSTPLHRGLSSKTIEVWVQLDNLAQRGGGAMSIATREGLVFDSIVFGEREPLRWMAGSEGFSRYQSVSGTEEKDALKKPVHIAITYSALGTIRVYRDGVPYGKAYETAKPAVFAAGEAVILFGQRHTPAGANRGLAGTVLRPGCTIGARGRRDCSISGELPRIRPLRRGRRGLDAEAQGGARRDPGGDRASAHLARGEPARSRGCPQGTWRDAHRDPWESQSTGRRREAGRNRRDCRAGG